MTKNNYKKRTIFGQNLRQLRELKQLNQAELGAKVGASVGQISSYEVDGILPKAKVSENLFRFFGITYEELFNRKILLNDNKISFQEAPEDKKGVRYYDVDAIGGEMKIFQDKVENEYVAAVLDVPSFNDCEIALNVAGDSMQPVYNSGEIIFCKKLTDYTVIPYGEAYLIITEEHRLIKYIQKGSTKNSISLVSENKKYDTFEIPIKSIKHLFLIKGKIKRNVI